MKKILLGTVAVVAIAFPGAAAAATGLSNVSGTISGDYGVVLNNGSDNAYGFDATIQVPFGSVGIAEDTGMEALGGYHAFESDGNFSNVGAALYAGGTGGRVAASYLYHTVGSNFQSQYGLGGLNFHTFGAGGEWFVSPKITLSARGGAVSFEGSGGGYAGFQGTWYVIPDLALSADVNYWTAGFNATSENLQVEWMPSTTVPASGFVSFEHINTLGLSVNAVYIGVKFYLHGDGPATLVDRQRKESNGYIVQSPLFLEK
jgi:hypothetical protein